MPSQEQQEAEAHLLRYRNTASNSWKKRRVETLVDVQENLDRYRDKFNVTILHATSIPPDYFLMGVKRNPISGAFRMEGVDPEFDFAFVDLFERPYACSTPEDLERDQYLYKPRMLTCYSSFHFIDRLNINNYYLTSVD